MGYRGIAGFLLAAVQLIVMTQARYATAAETSPADSEIVLQAKIERTDVRDYVAVRYSPLRTSFKIPVGAYLEYEMWHNPQNVSFRGGVELFTERGRFTNHDEITDLNRVPPTLDTDLSRFTKGKWYTRRFSLKTFEGTTISEISLVCSAGWPGKIGVNESRFRHIRLVDQDGKVLQDFSPAAGWLPFPLMVSEAYTPSVQAQVVGLIGASFEPARWLTAAEQPLDGVIHLKNFDPRSPASFSYALKLGAMNTNSTLAGESGNVTLAAGETRDLPVHFAAMGHGHWRPSIELNSQGHRADLQGDAITALSQEELAARKAPFTPGGFGMGAVPIAGGADMSSLTALREQGANYYQLRVNWSQIETAPGVYDLSTIRKSLEVARRCGMWTQIDFYCGYPEYTVPKWHWDDEMRTNAGARGDGRHMSIAYWSPARQAGLKALAALLDAFGSDPSVIAWNAWMGGDMDSFYGTKLAFSQKQLNDYSESSQVNFRRYVRDILRLSLAEASARYNMNLQDWDQLVQPQPTPGQVDLRPIWKDFMEYRLWTIAEVQKQASVLIRQKNPKTIIEYLYGGSLSGAYQGNNYDVGIRSALEFGGSFHQTASPSPADQAYLGTARRQSGMLFSIETAGTPASVAQHQQAMYELLTQEAAAYTWIQSSGVLVCPTPSHGFGELRAALERMDGAQPVGPSVALVLPYSSQMVDLFGAKLPFPRQYFQNLADYMEASGFNYDIYSDRRPDAPWEKYPLVIDGLSAAMEASTAEALARYVNRGGNLMLFTSTGEFTPGQPEARFELLSKLGCQMPPESAESPAPMNIVFDGPLAGARMALAYGRSIGKLPAGATILARNDKGEPALATWNVGKGHVYLWAGWPDFKNRWSIPMAGDDKRDGAPKSATHNSVELLIQQWTGVTPPVSLSAAGVRCALRTNGQDDFLILFNNSDRPLTVPLPAEGFAAAKSHVAELVEWQVIKDGGNKSMTLFMAPWDVKVVQYAARPIARPVLDFPDRIRQTPPPLNAYAGAALRALITGEPNNQEDHAPALAQTVEVRSEAVVTIPVPADGSYDIMCKLAEANAAFSLIDLQNGRALVANAQMSSRLSLAYNPCRTKDGAIRLQVKTKQPLRLEWLAASPAWKPVQSVWLSPSYENPGSFPGRNYKTALQPETLLNSPAQWKTLPDGWTLRSPENGYIDLSGLKPEHGIAYVAWEKNVSGAKTSLLSIGADYGLRLWVNGTEVFDSLKMSRSGPAREDEFIVPVQLRDGNNRFVAKIARGSQGWGLWMKELRE